MAIYGCTMKVGALAAPWGCVCVGGSFGPHPVCSHLYDRQMTCDLPGDIWYWEANIMTICNDKTVTAPRGALYITLTASCHCFSYLHCICWDLVIQGSGGPPITPPYSCTLRGVSDAGPCSGG
ncbi:hypothetical protein GDO81_002896 [Engystomops pustulosus]|uniref:Uncharacterized protein n=1 Tax=Engystomops pustulosus TaxID=76066 RepID=A0AAV7DPR8_ENGPU|nr:hypothetical protein GDO81_002896 [Engystomops pustulosus]